MNFFKLYVGDYMRDTGTLSVAEHGAYMLMLMHHYATERPLPTGRDLHRLLRAESKADRDAIDTVARKFWRETPDGWVNDRAASEMKRAEHQREVNRLVGARGGRPKRKETESVTESQANRNPNQTPDTRHQTKDTHTPPSAPNSEVTPTDAGRVCGVMRRAGVQDGNSGHPDLLALLAAGATDAEFAGAARVAAAKGKGFAYAIGMLKRQREEAAAMTLHQGPMPSRAPTAAEQRVMQATPGLVAPHLRAVKPAIVLEDTDDSAIRLG